MVTQNLVNGLDAPVRATFTNAGVPQNPGTAGNANLWLGAGIRLVGADAANSLIARNNIVDNAYGVFNAEADGTTPSATAVPAPDNWWGKRFTTQATNPGPAISPMTNPPVPENPVNGTPVPDGAGTSSSAVDFVPFRSGPQSDPLTGQYPNIEAPSAVARRGADDHAQRRPGLRAAAARSWRSAPSRPTTSASGASRSTTAASASARWRARRT